MTAVSDSQGVVVLLHGVLMKGRIMAFLRRHLRAAGWQTAVFDYASRRQTVLENGADLARFLRRFDGRPVYLVAHSLGGRVCLQCLRDYPDLNIRRVVAIGTPFAASEVAHSLARYRCGRWLLGQSLGEGGLLSDSGGWHGSAELGVIAGARRLGIGWLFGALRPPHDGTVTLASTRLEGMRDHLVVNRSHTTLLYSGQVAEQVMHFIDHGVFKRP